jgi:hypothetical protein
LFSQQLIVRLMSVLPVGLLRDSTLVGETDFKRHRRGDVRVLIKLQFQGRRWWEVKDDHEEKGLH